MGLYQRRRPAPIQILPNPVRRQDEPESPDSASSLEGGASSPESASSVEDASGLASPASPKATEVTLQAEVTEPDSPKTTLASFTRAPPPPAQAAAPSQIAQAPPQVVSQAPASETVDTVQSSAAPASSAKPTPPPPPPPSSAALPSTAQSSTEQLSTEQPSTAQPAQPTQSAKGNGANAAVPVPQSSKDEVSSSIDSPSSSAPALQFDSSTSASSPVSTTTALPSTTGTALPMLSATEEASSTFSTARRPLSSPNATQIPVPTSETQPSSTSIALAPAQSETNGQESSSIGREPRPERPILSKGAEAAAITLSVLGFLALLIGLFVFLKRRRRRHNEFNMRHANDAFNPSNSGSLHAPETAHLNDAYGRPPVSHMSNSSTSSDLYGSAHYQRPDTVSTNNKSRYQRSNIAPTTPNPFADPPRNKAWDQLRGRPRSTTLTNRGSWEKNPFKDPVSERFDPFGELQEKARKERQRYLREAQEEAEEMRRRELEQEELERERFGLNTQRNGSDVTMGGIGVLDRTGSGRYR